MDAFLVLDPWRGTRILRVAEFERIIILEL